ACRRALLAPARAAALASCFLLLRDTMNLPSMLPPVSLPRSAALNHLFAASSHSSGRARIVSGLELRAEDRHWPDGSCEDASHDYNAHRDTADQRRTDSDPAIPGSRTEDRPEFRRTGRGQARVEGSAHQEGQHGP